MVSFNTRKFEVNIIRAREKFEPISIPLINTQPFYTVQGKRKKGGVRSRRTT